MTGCGSNPKQSRIVKCEGIGGPVSDVVPGQCTSPCTVDAATLTSMKDTAKTLADADCKIAGKNSCNGVYSNPHGSCSTKMIGEFAHCQFNMSLEYTGACY